MIVLGIDPGVTGGIAVLGGETLFGVYSIPSREGRKVSKRKRREVDARRFAGLMNELRASSWNIPPKVFIEDVHAMPKDGCVGAFTFGKGLGVVEGVLACFSIHEDNGNLVRVQPQAWTKAMGVWDKDHARRKAAKLWPAFAEQFATKAKGSGRADAALIGYYGLKMESKS